MPDVSMCMNEECPLKEKCYRFTATPNERIQSYGMFEPDKEGKCDYYLDNEKYTRTKKNNSRDL